MSHLSRVVRAAALAAMAIATGQAFAHAHLKTSSPAEGSEITSPGQIQLTFSEGLSLKFSGIKLNGSNQQAVKLGAGSLSEDGKTLTVPVTDKLQPGGYSLNWHALSVDGHKTQGTYGFTVKP